MKHLNFEYVKIHPKAIEPKKIKGNLGFDLSVVKDEKFYEYSWPKNPSPSTMPNDFRYMLKAGERRLFHTGLKMAIPTGYGVVFWDRSGLSAKHGLVKFAGCIDSTYRGEWMVCLWNSTNQDYEIIEGDRIIQAIVIQEFDVGFTENKALDDTERGEGGFGSSGR